MTLLAVGIYTFIIVFTIHRYEALCKEYKESIEDYKRALNLSRTYSNAEHYTQLQLQNKELIKQIQELWAGSEKIQYEHNTYKSNISNL